MYLTVCLVFMTTHFVYELNCNLSCNVSAEDAVFGFYALKPEARNALKS